MDAVYVDVVFVVNGIADFLALLAVAKAARIRARVARIATAAAVGGGYGVLACWPDMPQALSHPAAVSAASAVLVLAAFGFSDARRFARNWAAFGLVCFAMGGAVYGLQSLSASDGFDAGSGRNAGPPAGAGMLAAGVVVAIWLYRSGMRDIRERSLVADALATVRVRIGETTVSLRGLIDTGNRLYDPFTRSPVMIVEARVLSEWFPLACRRDETGEAWAALLRDPDRLPAVLRDRFRLVPYRGLNRDFRLMPAFRPDAVEVQWGGQRWEIADVLVGLDEGQLSSDEMYQAVLHPAMIDIVKEGSAVC